MFMKGKVSYVACGKCTAGGEGEHSDGFLDDSVSSHAQQNSVIQFKFENLSFSITKKKKKKKGVCT